MRCGFAGDGVKAMKAGKQFYTPRINSKQKFTNEERDFLRRRTEGFLLQGMRVPLGQVLEEVYLQGMRDTVDAMNHPNPPAQPSQ